MRVSAVLCGAAMFALASMAAHADNVGARGHGVHAQAHREDRRERERAENRHEVRHARDHHSEYDDSGTVFDPRRTSYRS